MLLATFEILKGRRVVGRIEVRDDGLPDYFSYYFFLGPYHRGFLKFPRNHGEAIAVAVGSRWADSFANQNVCKYVRRDGKLRKANPPVNRVLSGRWA